VIGQIDMHPILGGLPLGHPGEQPGRIAAKPPPLDVPTLGHADRGKAARRVRVERAAEGG
jgi:hypothetical protein